VEYDLRNDIYGHLSGLSRDFYGKFATGDVMARSTNDLGAVRMMAGPGLMYWSETSLTFVLAAIVMFSVDGPLTLAALAPAPVISLLVIYYGRRIHARFEQIQGVFSGISSRVQESISGMRVLRAYRQSDAELRTFETLNQDFIARNLELVRTTGVFEPLLHAMIGVTFLIVLWVGGVRLLNGSISLGSFVLFQTYMGMLVWPMIAMGWVINLMQRGTASLGRIREMLDMPAAIAAPVDALPLTAVRGEIEFRGVRLGYAAGEALRGIDLKIGAGETVALAGHTGCGKTSLVNLVPRLLDPTEGTVLVDGEDVRRYDPQALRRRIAMVPQETFLFSMTLGENVALGAPDAGREAILRAAGVAGLEPDLAAMPNGLETVVGEARGRMAMVLNVSEEVATARVCYSRGTVVGRPEKGGEPERVCTETERLQIPPFGTRMVPLEREGNTRFYLQAKGRAVVLRVLVPLAGAERNFAVDSTVRFGEVVR
jgi:ATP-binding cassette subfamily B protein